MIDDSIFLFLIFALALWVSVLLNRIAQLKRVVRRLRCDCPRWSLVAGPRVSTRVQHAPGCAFGLEGTTETTYSTRTERSAS